MLVKAGKMQDVRKEVCVCLYVSVVSLCTHSVRGVCIFMHCRIHTDCVLWVSV